MIKIMTTMLEMMTDEDFFGCDKKKIKGIYDMVVDSRNERLMKKEVANRVAKR